MRSKYLSRNAYKLILVLIVSSVFILDLGPTVRLASAASTGLFNYEFVVDSEGSTTVNIVYTTEEVSGSSWVLVPKFSDWANDTIKGTVTNWFLNDSENVAEGSFYFYEVLFFSFTSDGAEFEMQFQYNVTTAAMIIEPDGIFYSPQIGFESGNSLEATVDFPSGFKVISNDVLAYGSLGSYSPSSKSSTHVVFDSIPETENLLRIEIGFSTANKEPELLRITDGIFSFETVSRYAEYARSILNLYNRTYNDLVDLFNVTLEEANVRFFIPDFESLLSIGGYVPFTSNRMGDININIVFTRYVEGYIEVIALHELVHHFLWKAGISPRALLWFHEGMAQYVSMGIAYRIGFEGAGMMVNQMETSISQLKLVVGEDFGFLQQWSMTSQPQDVGSYYTAAYNVVKSLAENRGGLDYYARFFKLMNGETITSNSELGYYLSLTSKESVAESLNSWGFNVPDLYLYSPMLGNVKRVLSEVNPIFQPYKYIAELLYEQALSNARQDSVNEMNFFLTAAISVAKLAPLLTLMTVSGILFIIILLALKNKGVFWNY
jgi:hypothetical protein